MLWSPAVVVAHAGTELARLFGATVPADGCSAPYLAAATLLSFIYGALTVFLAEGLVRRLYGAPLGLLVGFGTWAATPLAYYSVFVPSAKKTCTPLAMERFAGLR